ncbi:hypothetical protein [Kocuria flava]|uniref:hypothetical protein n=1 Tax=Kocuria flava TaxID=446860 RepID=UPI002F925FB6
MSTDSEDEFAHFALDGGRFESEGFPVAALSELTIYSDLVYSIANSLYKINNPDRERGLRNFEENFDLRITGVWDASSHATLELPPAPGQLVNSFHDLFGEARDTFTKFITEVCSGSNDLPQYIKSPDLGKLKKLGRSLKDNENLSFGHPTNTSQRFTLTRDARVRIREFTAQFDRIYPMSSVGRMVKWDAEHHTFDLRTEDHGLIRCKGADQPSTELISFLSPDGISGPLIQVYGKAWISPEGQVQNFDSVDSVGEVDFEGTMRLFDKIRQCEELQDGWLGDGSVKPKQGAIERMDDLIPALAARDADIAALPDGGMRAEWSDSGEEFVLEISTEGKLLLCRIALHEADDFDHEEAYSREAAERFIHLGVVHE